MTLCLRRCRDDTLAPAALPTELKDNRGRISHAALERLMTLSTSLALPTISSPRLRRFCGRVPPYGFGGGFQKEIITQLPYLHFTLLSMKIASGARNGD